MNLDYGKRPVGGRGFGVAVLAAGALVAVLVGELWTAVKADKKSWERAGKAGSIPGRDGTAPRGDGLNGQVVKEQYKVSFKVLGQLGLPWEDLFGALEAAYSKDVALLSVRPDAASNSLTIVAETRDTIAMLDFVRQIRAQPGLSRAHLTGHKVQEDGRQGVRFTIVAGWRGSKSAGAPGK